jgi:hypothetical protein
VKERNGGGNKKKKTSGEGKEGGGEETRGVIEWRRPGVYVTGWMDGWMDIGRFHHPDNLCKQGSLSQFLRKWENPANRSRKKKNILKGIFFEKEFFLNFLLLCLFFRAKTFIFQKPIRFPQDVL